MWSVRILSGPEAGQIFDLKLGKNVFGRGTNCDFKVLSVGISKEHCEIHVYKDKMIVVDLKSSNGTFVNGVKIQNSIIRIGDKVSLFDIIMDVIPTPEIRPKKMPKVAQPVAPIMPRQNQPVYDGFVPAPAPSQYPAHGNAALQISGQIGMPNQMGMQQGFAQPQSVPNYSSENQAQAAAEVAPLTLSQKIDGYIEDVLMPAIYKLAVLFPFKHVMIGFVLIFIFGVTFLSMIPLSTITKESNIIEATKRVKSVARALAKVNEQALLSGQLGSLSVEEALKEDGIKEAFIIQQGDGLIIAPSEKAGRDSARPFILTARKEARASAGPVDADTIGASYPIGVYDPVSGEPSVKYHAVVLYDVSSMNVDQGRVISLFMQTLIIASIMGLVLYFLFSRLIEFPVRSLNQQIDQALRDKTDRTEVLFDDPSIQKLVSNVNTLLTRVMNSNDGSGDSAKPQQNRDLEYSNVVEMITQPALVIAPDHRVVCVNAQFEQLTQSSRDVVVNQSYQLFTDSSLVQIIDSLIVRAQQSPYERHLDRIPFSQFECDIQCQVFLDVSGQPEYFLMTLAKADNA